MAEKEINPIISGGGGCFRKGSQIQLQHGKTIAIEELKIGDEVLSFDENGDLHVGRVTKVHFHSDPQPILLVRFWNGKFFPTPNHWVLNQYGAFVEVDTMSMDMDALVDGMGHLRPITGKDVVGYEPVWNLTVEPYHTFICDNVRVHNGGHRERFPVISGGGGGSKGGGGRVSVEAKDNLDSKSSLSIIDLLGEGQIGGLVNGAKSIYINGTPLMNATGAYNFQGVAWDQRVGTQSQQPITGFVNVAPTSNPNGPAGDLPQSVADVETPHFVNQLVSFDLPVTYSVQNTNATRIRVIINIPQLLTQDKATGDVNGGKITFAINISVDGGGFSTLLATQTIRGKTSSKFLKSYDLAIPAGTLRTIQVIRTTKDSTTLSKVNAFYLDTVVEIIDSKLNYPNSAMVAVTIDPQYFSSVPSRAYLVSGLVCRVPSNYDPATNTYGSVWNGSFRMLATSNPAWILFDLLTHKRYGLGQNISESQIDKAKLYEIGKYCDQLVPNGFGGFEKRFTINTQITQLMDAYKVIADISSAFRGMAYWDGSGVQFYQDSPSDPVILHSNANVKDGVFTYTGSSLKDRHSVVHVRWNDPSDSYKQKVEYVENRDLIQRFGIRKVETVAFGCTSRGQAQRVGRWILYTEQAESNMVTYQVGLDSALVRPGQIVKIQDMYRAGKRMSGRIASTTLTSVSLDGAIDLVGSNAILTLMMPDGTMVDRTVINPPGHHDTLGWISPLPDLPVENSMWSVTEPGNLVPMLARVINVAADAGGTEFTISAVEHNPSKYAAIEEGLAIQQPPTTVIDANFDPASNVTFFESTYFQSPGVLGIKLHVSWEGRAKRWIVRWRWAPASDLDAVSNWTTQFVDTPDLELVGISVGTYDFTIVGISALDNKSPETNASYSVLGKRSPPGQPTNLQALGDWRSIILKWVNPDDFDLSHIEVWSSNLPLTDPTLATKLVDVVGTTFTHSGLNPSTTVYYWVRAVNAWGVAGPFNSNLPTSATTLLEVNYIMDALNGAINESALTQSLAQRIDLIDADELMAGSVNNRIAAIASGQTPVQVHFAIFAPNPPNRVGDLWFSFPPDSKMYEWNGSTWVGKPQADLPFGLYFTSAEPTGVFHEGDLWIDTTKTNGDAGFIHQWDGLIWAETTNPQIMATYRSIASARSSAIAQSASLINTVQSRLDNFSGSTAVSIEEKMTTTVDTVSGLSGQYSVKVDNNGYVAGFGLASTPKNGTPLSEFYIRADRFAVGTPTAPRTVDQDGNPVSPVPPADFPFVVIPSSTVINGVTVPAGTYIRQAWIGNGWIDNAKIGNVIQSANFNIDDPTIAGWQIDKAGNVTVHGALNVRSADGSYILKTGKLTEGSGNNLLTNPSFSGGSYFFWASTSNPALNYGVNLSADWVLGGTTSVGYSNAVAYAHQTGADQTINGVFYQDVPMVEGGLWYEASVYTGAHRCAAQIIIQWYDASNAFILNSGSPFNSAEKAGGKNMGDYKRLFVAAQAPANAVRAQVWLYKGPTFVGQADSYAFFAMPLFARCYPNQENPSPWSAGKPALALGDGVYNHGSMALLNQIPNGTYIANAIVDTLHVAGNAITAPMWWGFGGTIWAFAADVGLAIVPVMLPAIGGFNETINWLITISGNIHCNTGVAEVGFSIAHNGAPVSAGATFIPNAGAIFSVNAPESSAFSISGMLQLSTLQSRYIVLSSGSSGTGNIQLNNLNITAVAYRR